MKTIELRAAKTQQAVLDGQCDIEETHETVKEAKARARYVLTEDYRQMAESSMCLGYAQVLVNGECVADFFTKA